MYMKHIRYKYKTYVVHHILSAVVYSYCNAGGKVEVENSTNNCVAHELNYAL